MQNLASHPESTVLCAAELGAAGIPLDFLAEPYGEPRSRVGGILHGFTFRRAWYYWVVIGMMPIEQARVLYADPVGLRAVRTAGFAGNDSPENHVEWVSADGVDLVIDPDGEQQADWARWAEKSEHMRETMSKLRFVPEVPSDARGYITSYHVDSADGLRLLADTIRSLAS